MLQQTDSGSTQSLPVSSLSSLPSHQHVLSARLTLHLTNVTRTFDSLASVFISRLLNSFKIKTKQTPLAAPED